MKKRRKKLHRSNEGYTLVELIVTMLISSIVTLAVSGFLIMGIQYYNRTNAETTLQTESQVAEFPNPRSIEAVTALAKYRGATVGVKAAEALAVVREIG